MTSRDRAMEFFDVIRCSLGRHVRRTTDVRYPRKHKYIQSYAVFMVIAKTTGKNMGSTYIKLEKTHFNGKENINFQRTASRNTVTAVHNIGGLK